MIPKGTAAFYGCLTLKNSPLVSDTFHSNAQKNVIVFTVLVYVV